jgi:hypothetical protein
MRWSGRVAGLAVLLVAGAVLATAARAEAAPPKRVLIIVLDQFRPDYVDEFDMTNVQRLMHDGVNFKNAYLGHMGSETVVSHNVITSGQLPRDMGWADEAYRDVDGVLDAANPGRMYVTGSLGRTDFDKLIAHGGYWKLADYLHDAHPDTKFITAGQKNYAVYSANGPSGDISVTFSSRVTCNGVANLRMPFGLSVPSYLLTPECGRFWVDSASSNDYGTKTTAPAWLYPLDGNRFAPGRDPAHRGGDIWTADVGMAMMGEEDWSGMLLTLGSIDKASHMWGGITDTGTYPDGSDEQQAHLRFIAKTADDQVGRILARLRELGQDDETLVVLTTDHAGEPSLNFNGELGTAAAPRDGNLNWYYGATPTTGSFLSPSSSLAPLIATDNVRFTYQDSAIRTWLTDTSDAAKTTAAQVMATLPDVIATYALDGGHYRRVTANTAAMTGHERNWWQLHGQEIVDTMAAPYSADVVGLLRDNTSYGVAGDHGGAQQPVQEIPIVFAGAGVGKHDSKAAIRSVDILPTILDRMGIAGHADLDGHAVSLDGG